MRKCWNCGEPTNDNDLRVCSDPICGQAAISSRAKIKASKDDARQQAREHYHRPEVKERVSKQMREYHQRPEVKERKREREREYAQRPEVKERERKRKRERYHRLKKLREEE